MYNNHDNIYHPFIHLTLCNTSTAFEMFMMFIFVGICFNSKTQKRNLAFDSNKINNQTADSL